MQTIQDFEDECPETLPSGGDNVDLDVCWSCGHDCRGPKLEGCIALHTWEVVES